MLCGWVSILNLTGMLNLCPFWKRVDPDKLLRLHTVFLGERSGSDCGRVLDSRPKGGGFEPYRRHCVVVLEQDTFILA